jgi:beta-barrel assembly-enhancing protease
MPDYANEASGGGDSPGFRISGRLIVALIVAAISIIAYLSSTQYNPITNQKQHVDISPQQEIALGMQATPEMANQFGGDSHDPAMIAEVTDIGNSIVSKTEVSSTPYKFDFHVLADQKTINAFALPGGQVFITQGLLNLLTTRGEIACTLAHEIGHVAARHSAQQIAKQELSQGLSGAAVLATYDPNDPSTQNTAAVAALISQVISLRYGRQDELEADKLGVRFATKAGYDPRSMIRVMEKLDKASKSRMPEFFSTHPNPEHRIERIKQAIAEEFPNGLPDGLIQ